MMICSLSGVILFVVPTQTRGSYIRSGRCIWKNHRPERRRTKGRTSSGASLNIVLRFLLGSGFRQYSLLSKDRNGREWRRRLQGRKGTRPGGTVGGIVNRC